MSDDNHILSAVSFHFSCGGFFGGYGDVTVKKEGDHAVLTVSPSMLREGKVEDTTKELTIAEWNGFISDVDPHDTFTTRYTGMGCSFLSGDPRSLCSALH